MRGYTFNIRNDSAILFNDNSLQISRKHLNKIMSYIESGVKEGAKLECGGKRVGTNGFYMQPTVFSDVKDEMKIAREEVRITLLLTNVASV